MRHGVKFLVNELLSNTTVNFGCTSIWTNPYKKLLKFVRKVLKFVLEIMQGPSALQIIKLATFKGGTF